MALKRFAGFTFVAASRCVVDPLLFVVALVLFVVAPTLFVDGLASYAQSPYPPSHAISAMTIDWSTHPRAAQGSDNFQLTWAGDDRQYGWWGDGGGFGGSNGNARVGLGFARVEGGPQDWRGSNVWGGKDAENAATFEGKSWGTVVVNDVLYSWVVPDVPDSGGKRDHYRYIELARSSDWGASWTKADWRWRIEDELIIPTFLNFGRNNAFARDDFVYSYFIRPSRATVTQSNHGLEVHQPVVIFLSRVKTREVFDGRERYEWFTGIVDGRPTWGLLDQKQAVFEDPSGTGWCVSAIYNAGLKRYLLSTEHTRSHAGLIGIFDAADPWGPWTTVKYWDEEKPFGSERGEGDLDWKNNVFFLSFAPKWFRDAGASFTLTFTGSGRGNDNDSFNTVNGRFLVR